MAGNARKQGSRVTAKGTQPPPKKGKGSRTTPESAPPTPNRQMRRAGVTDTETKPSNQKRSRIILIAAAVALGLLTLACMVLLGWSGTWIGLLGIAAGAGVAIAISVGKTWVVERGRLIAIAIGAVGVLSAIVGYTQVIPMGLWWTAPIGCAVGALFAEVTYQQTVPPQSPPATALAMLRRGGAQTMDAPGLGESVWVTPDRKVRVIVGATLGRKTTMEKLLNDKSVRKSRQRGAMIHKRLGPLDPQDGVVCVVDAGIPTTRDGDDTICSVGSLSKVLGKWNPGPAMPTPQARNRR